jgi:glucose repression regulatory protein TUP1
VSSVAVSHDNQWVVSGSYDQSVRFWDLRTGEAQLILHGHTGPGTSQHVGIACVCDSFLIAQCVCMHAHVVYSVDLSPTGDMLATSDWTGRVRLCACLSLILTGNSC